MNNKTKKISYFFLFLAFLISITLWFFYNNNTYKDTRIINKTDQDNVSIVLTKDGFEPRYVRIKEGTTVVFSTIVDRSFWPASNLHPSHGIYPEFDTKKPLNTDKTWAFTFNESGTWGFHDHIRSYFNGVIYVE